MRENPPWADRALKTNWTAIQREAESRGLPLPTKHPSRWKFEELGCGHYGCVMPTSDEGIVFKLTSDPTEAAFIQHAAPLGWPEGIVRYYGIVRMDFSFRRRPVYAIWREEAFNVGQLCPRYGAKRDYEYRARAEFCDYLTDFKSNAARFRDQLKRAKDPAKLLAESREDRWERWAWDNISTDEARGRRSGEWGIPRYPAFRNLQGAQKLAASWRACEIIAELMEHTYLSDQVGGAFSFYMEHGILLADVHAGNVGQANREDYDNLWVITDPGHVVILEES